MANMLLLITSVKQLYYQNYENLSPILTMIRLLPMLPSGVLCNVIIALMVARVDGVVLIGELLYPQLHLTLHF